MTNKIKNLQKQVLSNNWYHLYKYSFDYQKADGHWEHQEREAYDRGNGATILLYHPDKKTVILTRQFRLPTFVNGNPDGFLIEACAGLLDTQQPESCIRKETQEETGYQIEQVEKVFEAYMSPGSVTEILHFFIAQYSEFMRTTVGGGLAQEQEYIEVLELGFEQAYAMIASGELKDAKTIMLLQYAKLHLNLSTF